MRILVRLALCCIAVLILLFVALLPHLISTDTGREFLVNAINQHGRYQIEVSCLDLSWFGSQEIRAFKATDQKKNHIVAFELFKTDSSLLSLLTSFYTNNYKFKNTLLVKPEVIVYKQFEDKPSSCAAAPRKVRKKSYRIPHLRGTLKIEDGYFQLQSTGLESTKIKDISFEKSRSSFQLSATTEQRGAQGKIHATGQSGKQWNLQSDITSFPIILLDELQGTRCLTSLLGEQADLHIEMQRNQQTASLNATISSQNLKGKLFGSTVSNTFVLDPKSALTLTITPQFFTQFFVAQEWKLASKADLKITFEELCYPLKNRTPSYDQIPLKAHINVERAQITHPEYGNFSLSSFIAEIQSKQDIVLTYSGEIQSKGGNSNLKGEVALTENETLLFQSNISNFPTLFLEGKYLPNYVGSNLNITTQGSWDKNTLSTNFQIESPKINVKGSATGESVEALDISLRGNFLPPTHTASLIGPQVEIFAKGHLELDPFIISDIDASLQNDNLKMDILGVISDCPEKMRLRAKTVVFNLPYRKEGIEAAAFDEGEISLEVDGEKNAIVAEAHLSCSDKFICNLNATGQVTHFIVDNKIDFNAAQYLIRGDGKNIPVSFINTLIEAKTPLEKFFGDCFDFHLETTYAPYQQQEHLLFVDVRAEGEGFHVDGTFSLDGTLQVAVDKPASVQWELTPARYQSLKQLLGIEGQTRYILADSALIELTIRELSCPSTRDMPLSHFLCQSGFGGDVTIQGLSFKDPTSKDFLHFEEVKGEIHGTDFSKGIEMKLAGKIEAAPIPLNQKAGFYFEGKMSDFWSPQELFNKEKLKVKGELKLDLVPVVQLLRLLPLETQTKTATHALLGEFLNARCYGEIVGGLNGPVTIDLKSSNFKALIPAYFEGGALRLLKAVEAELTLTQSVSEHFLKDVAPILITGAWSEHPVKLFIDAEGFYFPIHPFSLQHVQIGKVVIDLGRIFVRNGGALQGLMNFLKAKDVSPDGEMQAWFTPIFASLSNGVASYKRFDILLGNTVHIALWGNIDLISDRVDMTLGISSKTLQQKFNIIGLTKKDIFQVKMKGTTSHVDLDWSAAYTRIGILIARTAGGGIGYIVGGLVEQILNAVNDAETPPPTTTPFPWETGETAPSETQPQESAPPADGSKKGFKKILQFLIP